MKKLIFNFIPLFVMVVMASCNKSSSNNNTTPSTPSTPTTPTTPTYALSVKINGTLYNATLPIASKSSIGLATWSGRIAYKSSNYGFVVSTQDYSGAKTYGGDTVITAINFNDLSDTSKVYVNLSGDVKIVVTSDDGTTSKGTFSGTAYKGFTSGPPYTDSLKFTEGSFTLKWQ
jgi:hypothetical protein